MIPHFFPFGLQAYVKKGKKIKQAKYTSNWE